MRRRPPNPTGSPSWRPASSRSPRATTRTFDLALKALAPLQECPGGWSLPVARALRLAGAAASCLGLLSDSLEFLNAAADIVDSLEGGADEVAKVGAAVHEQLARTKTGMMRRRDAVADLRRALELKGGFLKEGSAELGDAYRDVAEAYVGVLGFEKALALCLKALEIAEKRCGEGTTEVAKVRRLLMIVYTGLGRNEEALEQNELAKMVYDRLGLDVELSLVEIDGANVRILLGRSEEAMSDLGRVMQRANKEIEEHALAFVRKRHVVLIWVFVLFHSICLVYFACLVCR